LPVGKNVLVLNGGDSPKRREVEEFTKKLVEVL
jgi:hypothetical protein